MKKTLLLTAIGFGIGFSAMAQTFTYEGIKYDVLDAEAKTAQTAAGSSYASPGNNVGRIDLVIPETVEFEGVSYTVTEVGENSFSDYNYTNNIKSIDLPAGITNLGKFAFCYISNCEEIIMRSVTPPSTNSSFSGFTKCPIYVPSTSVTAYEEAFPGWTIAAIGQVAVNPNFEYDGILYTITDMEAKTLETRQDVNVLITSDGTYSSGHVANNDVTGDVNIPETIEYEGETYTVTSIGYGSFFGASVSSLNLPATITEIQDYAFSYNLSLKSIDFEKTAVKTIGKYAFFYNDALKTLVLPEKVEQLGEESFEWCDGISSVVLPATVSFIGQGAFNGCTELVSFTCYAVVPPTLEVGDLLVFSEVTKDLCTLYVPTGSEDDYAVSDNYQWGYYFENIQGTLEAGIEGIEIDNNAPVEYYNLQGVKVINPESGQVLIRRQGKAVSKVIVR